MSNSYSGHTHCLKCGKTHWMHGPCAGVSDTPRTDAEEYCQWVQSSFARKLERELTTAQAELKCSMSFECVRAKVAERTAELENENTKLKEERENWRVSSVCRELEAENADLRRQKHALLALIEKAMDVIP